MRASVIDATFGQADDTIQLYQRVGQTGTGYGFDVQAVAIDFTKEQILAQSLQSYVKLYNSSQEQLSQYLPADEEIELVFLNWGTC